MRVFSWLEGLATRCWTGTPWGSKCYDSSETGNASVTIGAQVYGSARAFSEHSYVENGQTTDLPDRVITLYAGEPDLEGECWALGNYWNGNTGLCEINPDGSNGSPIIIATGRSSNYKLTSAQDGVLFDIDGDGSPEQIAWTPADAEIAFLALDRDGDGYITSGKELFGDHTLPGSSNGFAALGRMVLESNGGVRRGSVSSDDPLFARLLLWTDSNHDGISEPGELRAASELLSDIGLAYGDHRRRDGNGNLYRYRGWVHIRTAPGRNQAKDRTDDLARQRYIYDVFLTKLR
jgi:hypothetical protein